MLSDGLNLTEGSVITNATIQSGTSFPASVSVGELFYRTDLESLYTFAGAEWVTTAGNASSLAGTTLAATVVNSSLTSVGTLSALAVSGNVTAATIPTSPNHLVNKEYVDSVALGLIVHESVRAGTTGNIALSGLQTIDTISLAEFDRVLVKNQVNAAQNGVYAVSTGAWTRATDFDGSPTAEVSSGDFVYIREGYALGGTGWTLVTPGTITVGTTGLTFSQITSAPATVDAGTLTGNTLAAGVTASSLTSVGSLSSLTVSGDTTLGTKYTETRTAITVGSTTQNLDCSLGNVFVLLLNSSISTLTFSNIPASGRVYNLTLFLTQGTGGSKTVTWPASVKFTGAAAPVLTSSAGKSDIITLVTHDGGSTWYGFVAGMNF